ncbi:MAG: TetR family transcriptional regulator [Lysinibacillus sp.]
MVDKQQKYEQILQAAIEVISEKGFLKTTISDIVKRANTAQGTFYLYFDSKNALIPAIANNLLSITLHRLTKGVPTDSDLWEALTIYIDVTFEITEQYKDIILLCYSGTAFDYSMETWEVIYTPLYEWLNELLHKGIANDNVLSSIPIHWTAKLIINCVENAAERFYIANDQLLTREDTKAELFQFIERSIKQ